MPFLPHWLGMAQGVVEHILTWSAVPIDLLMPSPSQGPSFWGRTSSQLRRWQQRGCRHPGETTPKPNPGPRAHPWALVPLHSGPCAHPTAHSAPAPLCATHSSEFTLALSSLILGAAFSSFGRLPLLAPSGRVPRLVHPTPSVHLGTVFPLADPFRTHFLVYRFTVRFVAQPVLYVLTVPVYKWF